MYFSEIKKIDNKYIANTYARFDLDIDIGKETACHDNAQNSYIDFSSGIGVNSLGFGNPQWCEAVKTQIDKLAHTSNLFYTVPQAELAKLLCEKTGMSKVFFSNSGAEANEGAIKTARKYSSDKYSADRCEIITLENSFHGRTIATLAATGQDVFHKNFGPFPAGFAYAEPNNIEGLKSKISGKTCAIMVECIQGEGGVVPLNRDFLEYISEVCAEKDILFIIDEIQTGVGRSGRFLCCSNYGIKPDIVTLAKGLGGGLPIGAVLFGEKTKNTLSYGDHGSTFGGNPVVCAGACEVVKSIDGKFLDKVIHKGELFHEELLKIDGVKSVSGMGLMIGVELEENLEASAVAKLAIKNGLIVLTAKNKVRLLPPLTIKEAEIKKGIAILKSTIEAYKKEILLNPEKE